MARHESKSSFGNGTRSAGRARHLDQRGSINSGSHAAVLSQAGAPLSWTKERAGTLFACERVRKAAASKRQPQRAERAMSTERADTLFVCER